jgi:hypothetical protein
MDKNPAVVGTLTAKGMDGAVVDDGFGTHGFYFPQLSHESLNKFKIRISKYETNPNIKGSND